jgi:peptidoglycan hydrolase CwlO-like protein
MAQPTPPNPPEKPQAAEQEASRDRLAKEMERLEREIDATVERIRSKKDPTKGLARLLSFSL